MIMLPILTISLRHFSLKGEENVLFELGSKRVRASHILTKRRRTDNFGCAPQIAASFDLIMAHFEYVVMDR